MLAAALQAGVPLQSLRTLGRISMHTSGNPEGISLRTPTIARHVGVSKRTVQRDVRGLEGRAERGRCSVCSSIVPARRIYARKDATDAKPPVLVPLHHRRRGARCAGSGLSCEARTPSGTGVEGLRVRRDRPRGERKRSWPSVYALPQVARLERGTVLFVEFTTSRAWQQATATQQGLLLYLLEALGPTGRRMSHQQIADEVRRSRSCVRAGVYYWRDAGWLEVEAQVSPEEGQCENFLRVRSPWDVAQPGALVTEDVRRRQALAPVTRWSGLRLAELHALGLEDGDEVGVWERVAAAVEDRDLEAAGELEATLTHYLNGRAREDGYKGSGRTRDVRAALPIVWDRREGFDREVAELRAEEQRNRPRERRFGDPWYGDLRPPQPDQAPLQSFDPEAWQRALAAGLPVDADTPHWRSQLRPLDVADGALVVVVENACYADWLADDPGFAEMARTLGGPIALRLASHQRMLETQASHAWVVGAGLQELDAALPRLHACEAILAALPREEAKPGTIGSPWWTAVQERNAAYFHARALCSGVGERFRVMRAAAAWTAARLDIEPNWEQARTVGRGALADLAAAEAAADAVRALGPVPADLDRTPVRRGR